MGRIQCDRADLRETGHLLSDLRTCCPVRRADQGRAIFSETRAVAAAWLRSPSGAVRRAAVSPLFARQTACGLVTRVGGQRPVRQATATDKIR